MKGNTVTSSRDPSEAIIASLEGLSTHTSEQTVSIRLLASAIEGESKARDRKVKQLQQVVIAGVVGILILIFGAGLNLYNTTKTAAIAQDTQQTNEILVGCFTPGSECQKQSQAAQKAQQDQIRQTVYVLFICSRLNPADPNNPDPEENAARLTACVNQYYKDFKVPPKVNPSPEPTVTTNK